MARQLKKNDRVVVIAGAEKGKRGRVLQVLREEGRVIVEGINVRKKATRRSNADPRGGIKTRECPIHISNVMLEERYDARHPEAAKAAEKTPDKAAAETAAPAGEAPSAPAQS